ncbi:hypothetical protein HKBW3S03_01696, partial [Candidatus Hakubella thermalkaliphila]
DQKDQLNSLAGCDKGSVKEAIKAVMVKFKEEAK